MRSIGRLGFGRISAGLVATLAFWTGFANATTLPCRIGNSDAWGAGWCDLSSALNLKAGEKLKLYLAPGAQSILVRLLPESQSPDSPSGMIGGVHQVKDGVVTVVIAADIDNIKQISVHGGPSPWGIRLGDGNRSAALISVERLP